MSSRLLLVSILAITVCLFVPSPKAQTAAGSPNSFQALVTDIQQQLTELGYRPGAVDGAVGERTRQAIRRYQSNTGLIVDGHPSEALRQHLRVTTGSAAPESATTSGAAKQSVAGPNARKAAWQGQTISDSLLRVAPSGASVSRQRLAKGIALDVMRRQGAWLEVRVRDSGAEGWVKQVSVRPLTTTVSAPKKEESGGFFANLARGVTRLLGGSSDDSQNQGSVTVGIRGLAAEDLATAIPDPDELEKMESYRADRDQAFRFAGEEQLTAQSIDYLPAAGAGSGSPPAAGRGDE